MPFPFELSDPPGYVDVSDPTSTIDRNQDAINAQLGYWLEQYVDAVERRDQGSRMMAHSFIGEFAEGGERYSRSDTQSPEEQENLRQQVLGALAMSHLARAIVANPDIEPTDGLATHNIQMMVDMYGDESPRLHMVHATHELLLPASHQAEQWYQKGNLFVKRTISAELSIRQQAALSHINVDLDPETMATLYPFLGRA